MGDMHLHHDLYREATGRRDRDAEQWARSKSLERDARSARARLVGRAGPRTRFTLVLSPLVVLAAIVLGNVIG
jgi:hypothetical protein